MSFKKLTLLFFISFLFQDSFSQIGSAEIQNISDAIFEKHLTAREYLTGGVISVVNRDSTLFKKGYGQANREKNILFDPFKTTVQIASVTKLITTTALLKLIEEGKIDLEKPIDDYLPDLSYNNPYDKKVLVKHLLTHTGGFDDRSNFMESKSKDGIPSLKTYAENYIPSVVWETGKFFNYSNYSFVLAAYLVEKISNTAFETYVQKNILKPLEMHHSGFGYEPKLMDDLMERYRLRENQENEIYSQKADTKYTNLLGVTGFKTTAEDMTHFMMMFLNKGSFKNNQILKPETIENAFKTHFTYDNAMGRQQGLGWRIKIENGHKLLYHYGDDTGVESGLVLFPEHDLGLFTAFNNPVGFDVKTEIQEAIFTELYGSSSQDDAAPGSNKNALDKIGGTYFYMNDSHTTFEKIAFLFGDRKIIVDTQGDSIVVIDGIKYKNTATPFLFQEIEGDQSQVKFIRDDSGNINHYSYGTSTFRKIGRWEDPSLHIKILVVCFAIFIAFLIVALIRAIRIKFVKRAPFSINRAVRVVVINTICVTLFVLGIMITISTISSLSYGMPFVFKALFILPILSIILLPVSFYFVLGELRHLLVARWLRALLIADVLALACGLVIFNVYNLIGFNFV